MFYRSEDDPEIERHRGEKRSPGCFEKQIPGRKYQAIQPRIDDA